MRNDTLSHYERIPTEADPLIRERTVEISSSSASSQINATTAVPVDPDTDDSLNHSNEEVIQPARKWIFEPAALMFAAAMLSQVSVITQYLYYRVGQQFNETVNSTRAFVCDSHSLANSSEHQLINHIQDEASQWTLYRMATSGIVALLVLPLFASASDYMGRWPALLLPCIGLAVDSVGLLLILLFDLPLYFLLISAGLGALGGGFGALFAAMFAYLADTTSRKDRPMRVAIVEGTFGLAGVVIELMVGWWMRLSGYLPPIIFSFALTMANLLYVVCFVPEVRPARLQRKFSGPSSVTNGGGDEKRISNKFRRLLRALLLPYSNIAGLFRINTRLSLTLALLFASVCIYSASFIGSSVVSSLYQMNYPFCLDSVFIGYLNAAKIVGFQIGVAVGLLIIRRYCRVKTLGLSILGLISATIGFLATGVAPSTPALFAAAAMGLFSMLPLPMLRAYASQVSPPNRQGALFSCIGVLEVTGSLMGSACFTLLYGATQQWLSGFVYLAVASSSFLALLLTIGCCLSNCSCPCRRSSL
ncbi:hypothetical protein BOX15_Mlig009231g1 [Macrostomum lignano]|uniref:Major facilitator superfamily (MFS) profile domain-containing protein n=1 Tax=Macrostomum lignano TaxID=282301 RepID=A0A267HA92_9PLAT|nr:hypothetical protein BOX15_Mlig009231g1 [Macrostomum lignano]